MFVRNKRAYADSVLGQDQLRRSADGRFALIAAVRCGVVRLRSANDKRPIVGTMSLLDYFRTAHPDTETQQCARGSTRRRRASGERAPTPSATASLAARTKTAPTKTPTQLRRPNLPERPKGLLAQRFRGRWERPPLHRALDQLRENDVLIV
jgi:hypothetical protein